jgi:hypothetical protein
LICRLIIRTLRDFFGPPRHYNQRSRRLHPAIEVLMLKRVAGRIESLAGAADRRTFHPNDLEPRS